MGRRTRETTQTRKPLPKGIKIQLKGQRTTQELRAMIHETVDQLEAMGIRNLRGINLYLTPTDEHGNPISRLSRTEKVHDLIIAEPYRSAAAEPRL